MTLLTIYRADENIIRQMIADKKTPMKIIYSGVKKSREINGDQKAVEKLLKSGVSVELINECLK